MRLVVFMHWVIFTGISNQSELLLMQVCFSELHLFYFCCSSCAQTYHAATCSSMPAVIFVSRILVFAKR